MCIISEYHIVSVSFNFYDTNTFSEMFFYFAYEFGRFLLKVGKIVGH